MSGTAFTLEVQPRIPDTLARLQELAGNLYFSWDRHTRGLFYRLDAELWEACRHNPRVFLRRVSQRRLEEAAVDAGFMEEFNRTLANFDLYHQGRPRGDQPHPLGSELVAYFCAEFGLHESLPVYSGGLGILAGDFCKAASDAALPFVAVGLFYRCGNLLQTIDDDGNQNSQCENPEPADLPIRPAVGADGREVVVSVEMPGSVVHVRVWHAQAGHTNLYLLDTDMDGNSATDRQITFQIYPAEKDARLRQEIIMGIGGVRALRALGLNPSVWHINEGHPSLMVLERCRELGQGGLDFFSALEAVAASTIFTTHTPVAAGHEIYEEPLLRAYLGPILRELRVSEQEFFNLGRNGGDGSFNLTTFALRCSRFFNGVSRIHRGVAAGLEKHIWPEIPIEENPFCHVTNGVHIPTFLSRDWLGALDDAGSHPEGVNPECWQRVRDIPDDRFWTLRRSLKANLLAECRRLVELRCRRHGYSQLQIDRCTELLRSTEDVMVIGFARRFAVYKRATLLFDDPDRLRRLLHDPRRPVLLIVAGRAHPADVPGQDLIRRINEIAKQPAFFGRVVLLEGYDLALARKLVAGADLWVNVPEYPLEASGTSGMKAAINGAINLSVLDGWWAEGYNGANGWALHPHVHEPNPGARRGVEARELMDTLEHKVIPLYFDRSDGIPHGWIDMARESMQSVMPNFSAKRMIMDYIDQMYLPSLQTLHRLLARGGAGARELAAWKRRVRERWHGVSLRRLGEPARAIRHGDAMEVRVGVILNGLDIGDVLVECLVGRTDIHGGFSVASRHVLEHAGAQENDAVYLGNVRVDQSGLVSYKLRAYPTHPLLCRRFEMGLMKWV
jgi:starch phosphorylase